MYICIYAYMYICIYVYMHICIYAYMYICIYVYMYICIYVYMYICKYVCMYMFEGSLEVKLPTIWTDEKQSRAEAERRGRLAERRSEEKE